MTRDARQAITVVVAGDVCPTGVPSKVRDAEEFNDRVFDGIRCVTAESDIAVVNLECPLTRRWSPISKTGPHLRADPSFAGILKSAGFTVASLANNHIKDMDNGGVSDTLAACVNSGLLTVGAGMNLAEAARPLILELKGYRLGILAMAEHEFSIASEHSAGACPFDLVDADRTIRSMRNRADFVLALVHAGNEFYPLPSPRMVKSCRFLVDAGADAVICHHIHVPSGMEVYQGRPIVYGTGNLFFPGGRHMPQGWYQGYMAKLSYSDQNGTTIELIPYLQDREGTHVRMMNADETSIFMQEVSRLSGIISDSIQLQERWNNFCRTLRPACLSRILSLTRLERKLLNRGVWPFWRLSRKRLPLLLNLLTCEAHHEVSICVLHDEIVSKETRVDQE